MNLTKREMEMIDAIVSIGKENVSMKEISDRLGVTYDHFMHTRNNIAKKNGYSTFIGFICDYVRHAEQKASTPAPNVDTHAAHL